MDTVILESNSRNVNVEIPLREVFVDSNDRMALLESNSRTVDVTMTYTLEEFYFISPFQSNFDIKEGTIW